MILSDLQQTDFEFQKKITADVENRGFTNEEVQQLAGEVPATATGEKGMKEFWDGLWSKNREVPDNIKDLKSQFGYQQQPVLMDLIETAKNQDINLDGQIKTLSAKYNFYLMRCGVFIKPEGNEKFEALKFEVSYKTKKVSTYTMLPVPETKDVFSVGVKSEVGVTGSAEFGLPPLSLGTVKVDASAKAKLEANFIYSFRYELKTRMVDAWGTGNPFCKWFMYKGDNLRNDVMFFPILMTPKNITAVECEFKAYFKIGHPQWKNSEFFLVDPYQTKVAS